MFLRIFVPFVLLSVCLIMGKMRFSVYTLAFSAIYSTSVSSRCATVGNVTLSWFPPNATQINDLSSVVNSTDTYGFVFNSSSNPPGVEYGTYNLCNMPHAREQEYVIPPSQYKLEYVEVVRCPCNGELPTILTTHKIHRHHKRTPYASNTFPHETYLWNCDDEALFFYGVPYPDGTAAQVNWKVYTSSSNPFPPTGFNGTCQFPQITGGGLQDSCQHGKDLYGVYHDLLGFLPEIYQPDQVNYRVTNNVITSQVSGQIIRGQYLSTSDTPISVSIQPASIDSLEPTISCPSASSLYSSYAVGSSNPAWTTHLVASQSLFSTLDSISGVNTTDSGWHNWFDRKFTLISLNTTPCFPTPNIMDAISAIVTLS